MRPRIKFQCLAEYSQKKIQRGNRMEREMDGKRDTKVDAPHFVFWGRRAGGVLQPVQSVGFRENRFETPSSWSRDV